MSESISEKKQRNLVLLANLGTPSSPTPSGVREFLKPFLSDKRVVEVPRPIWWLILNAIILPFRPKSIAKNYQALWDEYGDSPLRIFTHSQVKKLKELLNTDHAEQDILVDYVFTYGKPSLHKKLEEYKQLVDRIIILPLYPQYSCSTTAAIYDQLADYTKSVRDIPEVMVVKQYYDQASYQAVLQKSVEAFWAEHGKPDHLLASFHGVPKAFADKGDPYYHQCLATAETLFLGLSSDKVIEKDKTTVSFQSRLGKAEWLTPYTDATVEALAKQGVKTLDVICPSFSVDCLETLEEITIENGDIFKEHGGTSLRLIPCLNDQDEHVAMMADIVKPLLKGTLIEESSY